MFATNNSTATTTINKLKECVSRFGCPLTIVTDNGIQFSSEAFAKFCQDFGIDHVKTPPFHPQSNGQAVDTLLSRFVDTLKRGGEDVEDTLQIFLQTYRCTPTPSLPDNKSPAEVLLGNKPRSVLDLMKPSVPEPSHINEVQNMKFNKKHGAKHRSFEAGDAVFAEFHIRNERYWAQGTVIEKKGSVVYNILLEDKRRRGLIRSHVNQLRRRTPDGEHQPTAEQPLPLEILLEEFNCPGQLNQVKNIENLPILVDNPVPDPGSPRAGTFPEDVMQNPMEDAVPGPSQINQTTDPVPSRKRSLPFRGPSGRKRWLPSHFEYYELF